MRGFCGLLADPAQGLVELAECEVYVLVWVFSVQSHEDKLSIGGDLDVLSVMLYREHVQRDAAGVGFHGLCVTSVFRF